MPIQQEYGTDSASPRAGSLLGLHTQRWSKAAAVTLRKCSPHPPHHQHILPAGQAQRYQPADTFLLLPAAITTFPLGTFKEFSCALLSHSAGLPYPWCESQCNYQWEIRYLLPADCPSTGTEPCRASKLTLWLFLSLATDHHDQYPMCTG